MNTTNHQEFSIADINAGIVGTSIGSDLANGYLSLQQLPDRLQNDLSPSTRIPLFSHPSYIPYMDPKTVLPEQLMHPGQTNSPPVGGFLVDPVTGQVIYG